MPTAVIVDDSPVIRLQLRHILGNAGITVVGEAANGDDVRALYDHHRPDLLTLDVEMPGKDGVAIAVEILAAYPDARIVMCSAFNSYDRIMMCRRAGVRHYLLKPFETTRAQTVFQFALDNASRRVPEPRP